jgi:hypothetical protein
MPRRTISPAQLERALAIEGKDDPVEGASKSDVINVNEAASHARGLIQANATLFERLA